MFEPSANRMRSGFRLHREDKEVKEVEEAEEVKEGLIALLEAWSAGEA
jgi:hypothetical protein